MREECLEADIQVLVSIDAAGKVTAVSPLKESPHPEFNESAMRAALSQQWNPAVAKGHAVPSTIKYSYKFRIAPGGAQWPEHCKGSRPTGTPLMKPLQQPEMPQ
jgi:TonB family protein